METAGLSFVLKMCIAQGAVVQMDIIVSAFNPVPVVVNNCVQIPAQDFF